MSGCYEKKTLLRTEGTAHWAELRQATRGQPYLNINRYSTHSLRQQLLGPNPDCHTPNASVRPKSVPTLSLVYLLIKEAACEAR